MNDTRVDPAPSPLRGGAGVRLTAEATALAQPQRRHFLRLLAESGVALPAAYFLADDLAAKEISEAKAAPQGASAALAALRRLRGDAGSEPGRGHIVRDFSDPYIELIRLLREAAEVEHALMAQYLYAAFSVKPAYAAIAGFGNANANDLFGVAIQEMQHLGEVNRLLVELGAAPNLLRQSFPFEPAIYPFEFNLEPLGRHSLAKYVFTEAPVGSFERARARTPEAHRLIDEVERALGKTARPNHVGSLYATVIATLEEHIATGGRAARLKPWLPKLEEIRRQGEDEHFQFFKRLFTGTHPGFKGHPAIWSLAPGDPAYPALAVPVNPSAYVGHPQQIGDPLALSIAWLGNLHYWTILLLADFALIEDCRNCLDLARLQMLGPLMAVARHLPKLGCGIPFDPLSIGYAPCYRPAERLQFIASMVREADHLASQLKAHLPSDYPPGIGGETLAVLAEQRNRYLLAER